ncbi:LPS export ABC transporter periplasmic protein LptC [Candidatus Binatia bacterium]|nr:LPS export ABC transporter periplasmic protein LptC [Candidatus Binatia bacterium]
MQRTQIRKLLIVAVMLALAGLGFVLGRTMINQQAAVVAPESDGLAPEVSQRIKEFRRVKLKDGHKEWELVAEEAELVSDQGEIEISGPKLAFYGGDGRDVEVKGAAGRIFLENGDVQRIELSGGIDVTVGDYFVQTDTAIYFQNINSIAAPGEVRLKSSEMALTGQRMVLDLTTRKVLFRKGVSTTFESAPKPTPVREASSTGPQVP